MGYTGPQQAKRLHVDSDQGTRVGCIAGEHYHILLDGIAELHVGGKLPVVLETIDSNADHQQFP